jgi:hypothetical protein
LFKVSEIGMARAGMYRCQEKLGRARYNLLNDNFSLFMPGVSISSIV